MRTPDRSYAKAHDFGHVTPTILTNLDPQRCAVLFPSKHVQHCTRLQLIRRRSFRLVRTSRHADDPLRITLDIPQIHTFDAEVLKQYAQMCFAWTIVPRVWQQELESTLGHRKPTGRKTGLASQKTRVVKCTAYLDVCIEQFLL